MAPTKLVADVVRLLTVPIFVALVAIFVTFVEIPDALVEISTSFELILVELVLILDSTSDIFPSVKVPSISASFSIVTVPEV